MIIAAETGRLFGVLGPSLGAKSRDELVRDYRGGESEQSLFLSTASNQRWARVHFVEEGG